MVTIKSIGIALVVLMVFIIAFLIYIIKNTKEENKEQKKKNQELEQSLSDLEKKNNAYRDAKMEFEEDVRKATGEHTDNNFNIGINILHKLSQGKKRNKE